MKSPESDFYFYLYFGGPPDLVYLDLPTWEKHGSHCPTLPLVISMPIAVTLRPPSESPSSGKQSSSGRGPGVGRSESDIISTSQLGDQVRRINTLTPLILI